MAYAKMQKVRSDYAFGLQSVNVAKDNLESIYAAWLAEHGGDEGKPTFGGRTIYAPFTSTGVHNSPPIPRATASIRLQGSYPVVYYFDGVQSALSPWRAVTRLTTGTFRFDLSTGLSEYYGRGQAIPASLFALSFVQCVSYYPPTGPVMQGMPPACVYAYTYDLQGGTFVLADVDFVFHLYGA